MYPNGEKYRPQDILPISIFCFENLKNKLLACIGWPYYIIENLTISYAMFIFFRIPLLTILHAQVNEQASVARKLFAGCVGIFFT